MNPGCGICIHYNQRSYLYTTGQRNVSGGIVWYRAWAKHRCNLKQEHLYPNHCDFEKDEVLQAELDKKYPDLKKYRDKLEKVEVFVKELIEKKRI